MTDWLYHRSKYDRLTAILVIRETDPANWPNRRRIIEGLIRVVQQKEPGAEDLIGVATGALGQVGPDAHDAIPALTALLGTSLAFNRAEAAIALWMIERSLNLMPVLKRELNNVPFAPTRSKIMAVLNEMEEATKPFREMTNSPGRSN